VAGSLKYFDHSTRSEVAVTEENPLPIALAGVSLVAGPPGPAGPAGPAGSADTASINAAFATAGTVADIYGRTAGGAPVHEALSALVLRALVTGLQFQWVFTTGASGERYLQLQAKLATGSTYQDMVGAKIPLADIVGSSGADLLDESANPVALSVINRGTHTSLRKARLTQATGGGSSVANFGFGSHQHMRGDWSGSSGSWIFERYAGGSAHDYSIVRSHDCDALQYGGQHMGWWSGVSGGVNTYSWTGYHDWCAYHYAKGRKLVLDIFGTPTFLARKFDGTNYIPDAYGIPGGCSYVEQADRAKYRQFVQDTVAYTNTNFPGFLIAVEAWNEGIGGDGEWEITDTGVTGHEYTLHADNSQFLHARGYRNDWGLTAIQQCMADITKDIYMGTKAADPSMTVIGFAHAWGTGAWLDKILAARTTEGENIWQFCDAFSFHPYGISDQIDPSNSSGRNLTAFTAAIRAKLPPSKASADLWATECAMPELWDMGLPSSSWWEGLYNSNKSALGSAQYAWAAEFRALGWRALITYSVDNGWATSPVNASAGWDGGSHGSGYNFLGLSGNDMGGAINTQIANSWSQVNADMHVWA